MGNLNSLFQRAVKQTLYQKHWLDLAEYACVVGSAVGALAVAAWGQAFYAVAPLTLALSLNVANRYRFEQQMQLSQHSEVTEVEQSVEKLERNTVKVIIKLRQQLSTEIESVCEQLSTKSTQPVAGEIQE